jgi:hypothetical protein
LRASADFSQWELKAYAYLDEKDHDVDHVLMNGSPALIIFFVLA